MRFISHLIFCLLVLRIICYVVLRAGEVMICDGREKSEKNRWCSRREELKLRFKRRKLKIEIVGVCVNSALDRRFMKFQLAHICRVDQKKSNLLVKYSWQLMKFSFFFCLPDNERQRWFFWRSTTDLNLRHFCIKSGFF